MIKSILLKNLVLSPRNVRGVHDEAADAELAADIAAHGLLQNLVVTPAKPRGTYAVEAGGRRLRALNALQEAGTLTADHAVACLVLTSDACVATEASLAENLQRLAMNPADECTAFGRLIEQGADVEGVARRFGLTVRHVEGRLRLAGLAPVVFAALGAGEITLDAAKAYAATSDQERQAYVFEQLSSSWGGAHPDSIRRMMVNATVPASDRRFLFVGEDAYVEAGGRIERDLFADQSEARVLDIAILERLAGDKLEVEAAWLAKEHGWGFVRPTLDAWVNGWQYDDLKRLPVEAEPLSDEENEAIATLEAEVEAQIAVLEDEDADEHARDAAETKVRELNAAIDAISDKPPAIDAETRAIAGVFVLIDAEGKPRLDGAVYVPAGADDAAAGGEGQVGDPAAPRDIGTASGTGSSSAADDAQPAAPRLPQRLLDELAMQRRDILALHVAADPALAFDLAVVVMLADEGGYAWDGCGSTLSARPPSDPVLRSAMPALPDTIAEAQAKADDALDRSWLEHDSMAGRFDAFRKLPTEQRSAWLGHAVARTLEASLSGGPGRSSAFHDHLGQLLGIDVARWWRPTALNWFDRVPKTLCLAALDEVGGPTLAARHAKAKKAEIAGACEKLFAGEAIVEAEVRTAALAWVPAVMRFAVESEAPPWIEEDASDASGEPGDPGGVDLALDESSDGVVIDATGEEPEPLEVEFVADDPKLAGVVFVFGNDDANACDEPVVDQAA